MHDTLQDGTARATQYFLTVVWIFKAWKNCMCFQTHLDAVKIGFFH